MQISEVTGESPVAVKENGQLLNGHGRMNRKPPTPRHASAPVESTTQTLQSKPQVLWTLTQPSDRDGSISLNVVWLMFAESVCRLHAAVAGLAF